MKKLLALIAVSCSLAACSDPINEGVAAASNDERSPLIYTTNYPLQYFAESIAGRTAEVRLAVPGDLDPAYWKPSADDVAAMQKADLVVLNGASYESWLGGVSLPPSRLVDSSDAFEERWIPLENETSHSHGTEGEHEHSGTAFTTWLDPTLAAAQAAAIHDALAEHWPEHSKSYAAELARLTEELMALEADLQEAREHSPEIAVLFSHPVYQYFARRFELPSRSVHWEPDQIPGEAQWQKLALMLEELPASWMIWESEPLPEISERLESIGIRSAVFDPCANRPSKGDYLTVMQENLEAIRPVFSSASP